MNNKVKQYNDTIRNLQKHIENLKKLQNNVISDDVEDNTLINDETINLIYNENSSSSSNNN